MHNLSRHLRDATQASKAIAPAFSKQKFHKPPQIYHLLITISLHFKNEKTKHSKLCRITNKGLFLRFKKNRNYNFRLLGYLLIIVIMIELNIDKISNDLHWGTSADSRRFLQNFSAL